MLTQEQFITNATKIHNEKYNYSKAQYVDFKTKICIICKREGHGEFFQLPSNHLKGQGCPKCGREKYSQERFVKDSKDIHGDLYDYSKVLYRDIKTKVEIICKKHASFFQSPEVHLRGSGCPHCGNIKRTNSLRMPFDTFVEKASKVHNNKYVYNEESYNSTAPHTVSITCCSGHAPYTFTQDVSRHLLGAGCPRCAGNERYTTHEYIQRAIEVHGDKYNYESTVYIGARDKVRIYCNTHKSYFEQRASHHLMGVGCPLCSNSKGESSIRQWLLSHNILFEQEKRFSDCCDVSPLPFDFCVYNTDKSIKCIIEYDGIQHFYASDFYGGESALFKTQMHDAMKNQYCEDSNIIIHRIPFWNIDKIPEILKPII